MLKFISLSLRPVSETEVYANISIVTRCFSWKSGATFVASSVSGTTTFNVEYVGQLSTATDGIILSVIEPPTNARRHGGVRIQLHSG